MVRFKVGGRERLRVFEERGSESSYLQRYQLHYLTSSRKLFSLPTPICFATTKEMTIGSSPGMFRPFPGKAAPEQAQQGLLRNNITV